MNDEDLLLSSCGTFDPKECLSAKELAEELVMKKYTVLIKEDLNRFNVWEAYEAQDNRFFVEVEEDGMVYYPVFYDNGVVEFQGWE